MNMKGQKREGSIKLKIILSRNGRYRIMIIIFFHNAKTKAGGISDMLRQSVPQERTAVL